MKSDLQNSDLKISGFFFIRFTPFIKQKHINIDNKVGKFKQLRCISFFFFQLFPGRILNGEGHIIVKTNQGPTKTNQTNYKD